MTSKKDNKTDIDLNKKIEEARKADKERLTEEEVASIEDGKINLETLKLKKELQEMSEMGKRAVAEMQNMKRRYEEDRKQLVSMATASLIQNLLPILDNFERAIQHMPNEAKEWCEGIKMSINQFHKVLQDEGLSEIESQGKPFNPDLHEALVHEAGEKDMIIEVLEKGYMLGNRILRHAKVKVGNGE